MSYSVLQSVLILAIVAGFIIGLPNRAYACSCVLLINTQAELANADAVFVGRVVSITEGAPSAMIHSGQALRYTFQVSTVWKGAAEPVVVATSDRSSSSCGYTFQQGREYLVFAGEFEGELYTGLCSRTAPLNDAREDLNALGAGQAVIQPVPESPSMMFWVLGCLGMIAILTLLVFGSRLFMVRSKQE